MNIKNNIDTLTQSLPKGCQLIVVSKTQSIEKIQQAYEAGHRHFGENKVQELTSKYEALPKDIHWHMIGHLQSNKVKYITPFVHFIHAVDSLKLLQEINKQGKKNSRVINCLFQVHIAREETKFGFSDTELLDLLQSGSMKELDHVCMRGLMGMATLTDDQQQIKKEFSGLKQLFIKIKSLHKNLPNIMMEELSMGMSNDYEIAAEQGSTMIRIGTAIFGERLKK